MSDDILNSNRAYGKTSAGVVGTSATTILYNGDTTNTPIYRINTLVITNISSSDIVDLDVYFIPFMGSNYYFCKGLRIPIKTQVTLLSKAENPYSITVLGAIYGIASVASSLHFIVSYDDISS